MTYAEKAELAVAMFYRQDKRVTLAEICRGLDVPLHLALTVLEEYNT